MGTHWKSARRKAPPAGTVKFKSLIDRCVALGASPASFVRGGVNYAAASSHVDLGPEDAEQAVFMAVCWSAGVLAWANMNGSHLSRASRAKATVLGRQKGVPDVSVRWGVIDGKPVTDVPDRFGGLPAMRTLDIEFKNPSLCTGPAKVEPLIKAKPEQRAIIERLRRLGGASTVCFTADDAVALLRAEGVLP